MSQVDSGLTPLYKLPMKDLIDAIVDYHARFDDRMDEIKDAMRFTTKFLNSTWFTEKIAKGTDGKDIQFNNEAEKTIWYQSRYPVIFPYAKVNQEEFESKMTVLELSLSAVFTVVKDLDKALYQLSNPAPVPQMPMGGTTVIVPQPQPPQKQGLLGRGEKPQKNVVDITPYARSVDLIDEIKQIPVLFDKVKDYHVHGKSRSYGLHMGKWRAQEVYLIEEDLEFHRTVKPRLLRLVQAAQEIFIKEEKVVIQAVLTQAQSENSRAMMAMPPGST